jgi:hypothetical protein
MGRCATSDVGHPIFERDSRLTRIELRAFSYLSSLTSITTPEHLMFIDGSSFAGLDRIAKSISEGNRSFVVESDFIFDFDNKHVILYFGNGCDIRIPVEILCSECFSYCESLSSISFERWSLMRHISSAALVGTRPLSRVRLCGCQGRPTRRAESLTVWIQFYGAFSGMDDELTES